MDSGFVLRTPRNDGKNRLRQTSDFTSAFKLICPVNIAGQK